MLPDREHVGSLRFVLLVAEHFREQMFSTCSLFLHLHKRMAERFVTSVPPRWDFPLDIEPVPTWFYHDGRQQFGPITADALFVLASTGLIAPTHKVWTDGLSTWIEAQRVSDLQFPS